MLILTRKLNEVIVIGDNIRVRVTMIGSYTVNLAVEAPSDVSIHREEIYNQVGGKRLHSIDEEIAQLMEKSK